MRWLKAKSLDIFCSLLSHLSFWISRKTYLGHAIRCSKFKNDFLFRNSYLFFICLCYITYDKFLMKKNANILSIYESIKISERLVIILNFFNVGVSNFVWNVRLWRHLLHREWCEPYGLFTINWITNHGSSYTFRRCLCCPSIKIPLMWHLWKGLCLDTHSLTICEATESKTIDSKCLYINRQLSVLKDFSLHVSESFWPFRVMLCVSMFTRPCLLMWLNFTHLTGRRILKINVRQWNIKKVKKNFPYLIC